MIRRLALLLALAIAGCASDPLPPDYSGPVAHLVDSVEFGDEVGRHIFYTRAEFFYASAIDGKQINETLSATKKSSYGKGPNMVVDTVDRTIPIRPLRVRLEARVSYLPPIAELMHIASVYHVEKTVEFLPVEGEKYAVRGKLAENDSDVWLENVRNGERLGTVVPPGK